MPFALVANVALQAVKRPTKKRKVHADCEEEETPMAAKAAAKPKAAKAAAKPKAKRTSTKAGPPAKGGRGEKNVDESTRYLPLNKLLSFDDTFFVMLVSVANALMI